jgi:hypothetical protein
MKVPSVIYFVCYILIIISSLSLTSLFRICNNFLIRLMVKLQETVYIDMEGFLGQSQIGVL